MIARFVSIFATCFICQHCFGLPEDPDEYSAWEVKALEDVRAQIAKPPEEAIPGLGLWLYKLNLPRNREKGTRPVFMAVREALLAIPDHATYYERRIKEAREEMVAENDVNIRGPLVVKYNNEQATGFAILGLLPSSESVRVLGEFLFDERDRVAPSPPGVPDNENARQYATGVNSNSVYALRAITGLPLVSKPVHRKPFSDGSYGDYPEDLQPWRLWYEQVRAGTRTFRFEGDPQEYSLTGPVVEAQSPSDVGAPKGSDLSLPHAQEAQTKAFPRSAILVVIGALGLCALGARRVIQARKLR